MKIGVLGGTFDPVHIGHLKIAGEARDSLGLSEVILVPAGQPPFKLDYPITSAEQRLEMLRLAIAEIPHFSISTIEVERPGTSYTVDTIAELRGQYDSKDEIYFIIGWDSLEQFAEWKEPSRITELCYPVAVPRPGWACPDLEVLEASVPGISRRVIFLEKPQIDISATAIRELAAQGRSLNNLVPGPVADYIREHKLYTN